jgi:glycosyltransferase involved in cell wall biosynthesis
MKYSVVIPTYNKCEQYLKPCIDSIIKYTDMELVEIIISANGCKDNTDAYLNYLATAIPHLKIVWDEYPLGFAKAINEGIKLCTSHKIILLNNDTILLEQPKNDWLNKLDNGDISAPLFLHSEITQRQFAVFFCVLIQKKVFDTIGLLPEDYEVGGNEDIEFCLLAESAGFKLHNCGNNDYFPIYHKAEGTMNDENLVNNWKQQFLLNQLQLAKKHNIEWYKWRLTNNYERAVFLKGDAVFPRETSRYKWASKQLINKSVLEIGCSTGYGSQFFDKNINYMGLDYDPIIIEVAKAQEWDGNIDFMHGDVNKTPLGQYGTIVAFEVIEHLDNGLEVVNYLKNQCLRLLISVPYNEPVGFWGEHHKLHGLTEKDFPDFQFEYIDEHGNLSKELNNNAKFNLMVCRWDSV